MFLFHLEVEGKMAPHVFFLIILCAISMAGRGSFTHVTYLYMRLLIKKTLRIIFIYFSAFFKMFSTIYMYIGCDTNSALSLNHLNHKNVGYFFYEHDEYEVAFGSMHLGF